MQQIDTIQRVPNLSTIFNSLVQFFVRSRVSTPQPAPFNINIDWSDSDSIPSDCKRDNKPVSGGYNEAFVMQQWASYGPRN